MVSFYDVLLVTPNASLDEIKLAFKRRALQVHPDKGGSKEAFHSVYEALETLADPEARKKYDQQLARKTHAQPQSSGRKKKPPGQKRTHPSRKDTHSKPQKHPSKKKPPGGSEPPAAPQSKETRLLMRIRDLLKWLPRDVRNDAIANQFSQKQRLILEKWMVENCDSRAKSRTAGALALAMPTKNVVVGSVETREHDAANSENLEKAWITDQMAPQKHATHSTLPPTLPGSTSAFSCGPIAQVPELRQRAHRRKIRNKTYKTSESKPKVRRIGGFVTAVKRGSSYYKATIRFDALDMHTGQCDLQTALEYLVILTSAKQKMLDGKSTDAASFEERLRAALESSAREQGKNMAELNLRFSVLQSVGFVVGNGFQLHSPIVRSIQELGKLRSCFEPFRQYAKKWGRRSAIWWYSPGHLEDAWERLQAAVVHAWEDIAGTDSTKFMQHIRQCYVANADFRQRQLQYWESCSMCSQDKNQYRPKRLQERSTKCFELRERQHMARQDKNEHRPKKFQERSAKLLQRRERLRMAKEDKNKHRPRGLRKKATSLQRWERQQMAMHDKNRHRPRRLRVSCARSPVENALPRKLLALKTLLARWEHVLRRQADLEKKRHRKTLRLRRLQQKKEQEEHKRSENLNRKRVREEEQIRRQLLRKRMKSTDLMSDLRWI